MNVNLTVFTAARSDFGILRSLIISIEKDKRFNLTLLINSAHISKKFGNTDQEIKEINIKNKVYLNFKYQNSKPEDILNYFRNITTEISSYIKIKRPAAFIIMGDRYEMLAAALTCLQYQVPIIHLCGGSITMGSLDNIYRDSISKMSDLHLVETIWHKNRLNKIGIQKNVYVVGAPALENLHLFKNISFSEVIQKFNLAIDISNKIIVACFHPETNISKVKNIKNLKTFLRFLESRNENIVFTYPNADSGFNDYIKLIKFYLFNKKNCTIVKNLGIKYYYTLLKNSDLLIGNSSSGIIESASFNLATINLGNRQKYRLANKNVIHSSFDKSEIKNSINKIKNKNFVKKVKKIKNIYFKKNTSIKIKELIFKLISNKI
jgi:UDP-hydrolysing UDP-N-acetyl-D-glucosamine 2-epimerase